MQVVGVLDLADGRAVHARGGHRDRYMPVGAVASVTIDPPGDALAVGQAYLDLGISGLYVADLDAIASRGAQDICVRSLAGLGLPLWVDAGVASVEQARRTHRTGATTVVVGLETLPSYEALREICASLGAGVIAFSLDLRNGEPVVGAGVPPGDLPEVVAARAVECGVHSIITIDLARVGTGAGLDLSLIGRLRAAVPGVALLAGGGVGGADDLARLGDAGCDGALVATALHDGRLGRAEVAAARLRQPRLRR